MNFSAILGVLIGGSVLYFALSDANSNIMYFANMHGILIVWGSTFAVSCIAFPIGTVLSLAKVFLLRVLGKNKVDYQGTIAQILELSKKATIGLSALNDSLPNLRHEFLKEGVQLVAAGVLSETEIRQVLDMRVKTTEKVYLHEANMFKSIGKFPPAFGLLATTLGMIAVLQKLGEPDSQKLIGPAMSIGLIGTLYGIATANFIFLPIAEALTERTHEEVRLRKMIVEGVCMIKSQINPISMREGLNSFLLPRDRLVKKAAA